MASKLWRFTLDGTGKEGNHWHTSGAIECEFADVALTALKQSFELLTEGKAIYGNPGPCGGPYQVHRFVATTYRGQ